MTYETILLGDFKILSYKAYESYRLLYCVFAELERVTWTFLG